MMNFEDFYVETIYPLLYLLAHEIDYKELLENEEEIEKFIEENLEAFISYLEKRNWQI